MPDPWCRPARPRPPVHRPGQPPGKFGCRVANGHIDLRLRQPSDAVEVSAFEIRRVEAGAVKMRPAEVGAFEMRVAEVGTFEMHPAKVGAPQNGVSEIENSVVPGFKTALVLVATANHSQHGCNVGCRRFSSIGLLSDALIERLGRPLDLGSLRSLADEGGQVLHHRPVVLGAFLRNPLERVDTAQPHLQLVTAELLDRLAEALGYAPLQVSPGLCLMPITGNTRLPARCLRLADRCIDQKDCTKTGEDRIDEGGIGIGNNTLVVFVALRIPGQHEQQQKKDDSTKHSEATGIGAGKGCLKRLGEPWLELSDGLVARTELSVQRGPGDAGGLGQPVQPPGQPDVDIERHRAVAQLADGGFQHGHGVIPERGIEGLVQDNPILPERPLDAVFGVEP